MDRVTPWAPIGAKNIYTAGRSLLILAGRNINPGSRVNIFLLINFSRISGNFTAPTAGVYLITFSYRSANVPGRETVVYIYKNGVRLEKTRYGTLYYNSQARSGQVQSTGGRSLYQRLEAGNTIHLQTGGGSGNMGELILCVEFSHK